MKKAVYSGTLHIFHVLDSLIHVSLYFKYKCMIKAWRGFGDLTRKIVRENVFVVNFGDHTVSSQKIL